MGDRSVQGFESWLHPSDVIEHYHQQREPDPRSLVAAMLSDGLLRAAAAKFVLNGRDHGLAIIPASLWISASGTDVWSTGRFAFVHVGSEAIIRASAYDVRIDPDIQTLSVPSPAITASAENPPLSEAELESWARLYFGANPEAAEDAARKALVAIFPAHFVSRERLRRIMPARPRGRPRKKKD